MTTQQLKEYSSPHAAVEVLGCLIKQPKLIKRHSLKHEYFVESLHKIIFSVISNLHKDGIKTIDAIAIEEHLLAGYPTQYKIFSHQNAGVDFINNSMDIALMENFKYYSDLLKKFALLRSYLEAGISVHEFHDPAEVNPTIIENKRAHLDNMSINDIIVHFKMKQLKIASGFLTFDDRESKRAGEGDREQKELFKQDDGYGIGYSSAFLTTAFSGMRKGKFLVRSAGSGVGKTRGSIADICFSCAPKYYDKKVGKWLDNPNGTQNRVLYIGTEMSLQDEISPILWAYMADVPQDHIQHNRYVGDEEERVDEAIRILEEEGHIWLEYIPDFDGESLENIIERHVVDNKIEYVFFDYIHSTAELISEYANASSTKMALREDQPLSALSARLKKLAKKYWIYIEAFTQVSGDFKNETVRDETIVRGAKAIIDKADFAMITMGPTTKELKAIEEIVTANPGMERPNIVYSIYKNRGGAVTRRKVWVNIDYSTMRVHDLFVTDYDFGVIPLEKTYITLVGEKRMSTNKKPGTSIGKPTIITPVEDDRF